MTAATGGTPTWKPTARQKEFLSTNAFEALYGGAAGGGKSEALLMAAVRFVDNPNYRALLLRRTFPDLERSLIDRSRRLYPALFPKAQYNSGQHFWKFPSGAQIQFGHMSEDGSTKGYQGAEYSFIGFDELTHFTEPQYTFMISRARSAYGLPVFIRAATNPGGIGHEWVMRRFAPWLDPRSPVRAEVGRKLWARRSADGLDEWFPDEQPQALSRVFVPARVSDNPYLVQNDPAYVARLQALDPITRAQLLDGNWLIAPAAGLLFKAHWFDIVDVAPRSDVVSRVRYWDRAATGEDEVQRERRDADWSVGLLLSRTRDGVFFIEDVQRFRGRPREVMDRVHHTAVLDGHGVSVVLEQDPASAGKTEIEVYRQRLVGFAVLGRRPDGDKVTRAKPASSYAEARNLKLLRAPWNAPFLAELEAFPDGTHDDQVDALSGAFAVASTPVPSIRDLAHYQALMPMARGAGVEPGPRRMAPLRGLPSMGRWTPSRSD